MQHGLHPGIAIIVSDIVCCLVEPEIGGEQAFGFQELTSWSVCAGMILTSFYERITLGRVGKARLA
jgi:hypothetical protein